MAAYFTLQLAWTAAWPRAMRVCDLPVPAGPIRATFSQTGIHSSDVTYAHVSGGIEEAVWSNSSAVLTTGNVAPLGRVGVLEASREATSASMRVRRISSGAQRWAFTVSSSSGRSGGWSTA